MTEEEERLGRIIRALTYDPEGARALRRVPTDVADIIMDEAQRHNVLVLDIMSPFKRDPDILRATRETAARIRGLERDGKPRFPWATVAKYLGRTNHTTMMYAERKRQEKLNARA